MAYFVTKALSISSFQVHFEEPGTHGQDCGLVPLLSSSSFPTTTSSDKLFSGFMIGRSPENKCIFNTTHSSFDKPNLSQIHGFEGRRNDNRCHGKRYPASPVQSSMGTGSQVARKCTISTMSSKTLENSCALPWYLPRVLGLQQLSQ